MQNIHIPGHASIRGLKTDVKRIYAYTYMSYISGTGYADHTHAYVYTCVYAMNIVVHTRMLQMAYMHYMYVCICVCVCVYI